MKPCIVSLALGPRYQPMLGRMLDELRKVSDNWPPVVAWCNTLPPRTLAVPEPYQAYVAKPFAMLAAAELGYDVLLWLDAACYPVSRLAPFFEMIESQGYYVQDNGWSVGIWSSDAALDRMSLTRDAAMQIPEISTMALGLNLSMEQSRSFLAEWASLADTFPGPHVNEKSNWVEAGLAPRTIGFVSDDRRVLGHRHDQTAASVLAWRRGWKRTRRGMWVDYETEHRSKETVVVNRGGFT